ncbi:MAG TPA: protein DA1 [Verrucomicrobiae bacterium]|nr:protein DA1 [Verrucomicrobiae bacterium]
MKRKLAIWTRRLCLLLCVLAGRPLLAAAADPEVCAICGQPFGDIYYALEDKVTLEKKHVCKTCEQSYPVCFVCGLPANTNLAGFKALPDARVLCSRDSATAVLQEEEGKQICRDVRDELNRLFSRFTTFPETNMTTRMVDRVHLVELFNLAGNDYRCPNVWGITETRTNHNRRFYVISLMSGLPRPWFEATCAHELGHAWVGDHVSAARKAVLSRDAEEGFCELLSFLLMDSRNDEPQQAHILRNPYTRGQIDFFVAAERIYGFNEILDWMQFGIDDRLSEDPSRIRNISQKLAANRWLNAVAPAGSPRPAPNALVLKAIIWDPRHPTALINNRPFAVGEQATVHVGTTNVLVRCLGITPDSVQLRIVNTDREETLMLNP